MAITQSGAAAGEFITAALAKLHAPIDHDDDDLLVASYIAAAKDWIERTCDAKFGRAEYTYVGDDFALSFSGYPNPAISSVTYVDVDDATQTLTDFSVDGFDLIVERPPLAKSVAVVFEAGYAEADIPAHYKQAGLMLIAAFYEERANVSDAMTQILPFGVRSLISASRTFAR